MQRINKKAISEFQKMLAGIVIAMLVAGVLLSADNSGDKVTGGATSILIKPEDKAKFDAIYTKYPQIPTGTLEGLYASESTYGTDVKHNDPRDVKAGSTGPLGLTGARYTDNRYNPVISTDAQGKPVRAYDPNTLEGSLEIAARWATQDLMKNPRYDSSASEQVRANQLQVAWNRGPAYMPTSNEVQQVLSSQGYADARIVYVGSPSTDRAIIGRFKNFNQGYSLGTGTVSVQTSTGVSYEAKPTGDGIYAVNYNYNKDPQATAYDVVSSAFGSNDPNVINQYKIIITGKEAILVNIGGTPEFYYKSDLDNSGNPLPGKSRVIMTQDTQIVIGEPQPTKTETLSSPLVQRAEGAPIGQQAPVPTAQSNVIKTEYERLGPNSYLESKWNGQQWVHRSCGAIYCSGWSTEVGSGYSKYQIDIINGLKSKNEQQGKDFIQSYTRDDQNFKLSGLQKLEPQAPLSEPGPIPAPVVTDDLINPLSEKDDAPVSTPSQQILSAKPAAPLPEITMYEGFNELRIKWDESSGKWQYYRCRYVYFGCGWNDASNNLLGIDGGYTRNQQEIIRGLANQNKDSGLAHLRSASERSGVSIEELPQGFTQPTFVTSDGPVDLKPGDTIIRIEDKYGGDKGVKYEVKQDASGNWYLRPIESGGVRIGDTKDFGKGGIPPIIEFKDGNFDLTGSYHGFTVAITKNKVAFSDKATNPSSPLKVPENFRKEQQAVLEEKKRQSAVTSPPPTPAISDDAIKSAIAYNTKYKDNVEEAIKILEEKGVPEEILNRLKGGTTEDSVREWMSLQASLGLGRIVEGKEKAVGVDGKVGTDETLPALQKLTNVQKVTIDGLEYLYLHDGQKGVLFGEGTVTKGDQIIKTQRILGELNYNDFGLLFSPPPPKFEINPSTGGVTIEGKSANWLATGDNSQVYKTEDGIYVVIDTKDTKYVYKIDEKEIYPLPDGRVMYSIEGVPMTTAAPIRPVQRTEERTIEGQKQTLTHTVYYDQVKGHAVRIVTQSPSGTVYMDLKAPNKDDLQQITSINGQDPVTYLSGGGDKLGFIYQQITGADQYGPIRQAESGTLQQGSEIYIGASGGLFGALGITGQELYVKVRDRFVVITCEKSAQQRCNEVLEGANRAVKIKIDEKIAARGGYFNWFGDLLAQVQSAVKGYSFFSFLYSEPAPFIDDPNLLNILGGPTGELYGWTSFICAEEATNIQDLGAAFATSLSGAFAHIEGEKATIIDFNASTGQRQPNLFLYKISLKVNPGIESRGCNMKFKVMISGVSGRRSMFVDDGDGSDFIFKVEAGEDPVDYSGNNLIFAQSKNNFDKVSISFLELTGNVVPCLDGVSEGDELTSKLIDNAPKELNFEDPCDGLYTFFMPDCWRGSGGGEGESTGKGTGGTTTGSQGGKRTGTKSGRPAVNI